jgi:hypothetical protein
METVALIKDTIFHNLGIFHFRKTAIRTGIN